MKKLLAAALALAVATPALARKVAGVEFPDSVEVGGQRLVLNGAGLRKKFIIKVYAGGLYVPQRAKDPATIVAVDAPKRVRMVFLRTVSKTQIMNAYREGFEKNSDGPGLRDLLLKLDQIAPTIPAELKEGAEMSVTYVPGEGTTVAASEGGRQAIVAGKEFADALFKNWLGSAPADEDLKAALLGK
ncbi:MAG TPA: chalcone isomerase family protein [Anaeromyxobacter sp.]